MSIKRAIDAAITAGIPAGELDVQVTAWIAKRWHLDEDCERKDKKQHETRVVSLKTIPEQRACAACATEWSIRGAWHAGGPQPPGTADVAHILAAADRIRGLRSAAGPRSRAELDPARLPGLAAEYHRLQAEGAPHPAAERAWNELLEEREAELEQAHTQVRADRRWGSVAVHHARKWRRDRGEACILGISPWYHLPPSLGRHRKARTEALLALVHHSFTPATSKHLLAHVPGRISDHIISELGDAPGLEMAEDVHLTTEELETLQALWPGTPLQDAIGMARLL